MKNGPETFLKMLIRIDKSVADGAVNNDDVTLLVVQSIATAQAMGYHIVWAEKSVLITLSQLKSLSTNDRQIFYAILQKYAVSGSSYSRIGFFLLVTYTQNTGRYNDHIAINPDDSPNFNFVNKTNILAENLDDATMFGFIGQYYIRQNPLFANIGIVYKKELGGGDTTAKKYEDFAKAGEKLCLSVLDGDIKYLGCSEGDTLKKVRNIDKRCPFNCLVYGTQEVREVENLIPDILYKGESNYKNTDIVSNNLCFNMSFFDIKEGLLYKSLWKEEARKYWKTVLVAYPAYISSIDFAEYLATNSKDSNEFKSICCNNIIIGGFGTKLFSYVLKNKATELGKIENVDLAKPNQETEWNTIGELVFRWCCSARVNKNSIRTMRI